LGGKTGQAGSDPIKEKNRYNVKNRKHTNHIKKNIFYDFHIHMATGCYRELGTREDAYAEKALLNGSGNRSDGCFGPKLACLRFFSSFFFVRVCPC
jgi:hypothetical protein